MFSTSFCAAPTGCDLIVYSDTTDPTEHLGCMIYVSAFCFGFWHLSDAGFSVKLVIKLVFPFFFFHIFEHTDNISHAVSQDLYVKHVICAMLSSKTSIQPAHHYAPCTY